MDYMLLVKDACKSYPHFLDQPTDVTARLLGSARTLSARLGTHASPRVPSEVLLHLTRAARLASGHIAYMRKSLDSRSTLC